MNELILKGINKVDEYTDAELLPLTTATRLENLVLDNQLNKPTKRGGFSSFNANSAGGAVYSIKDLVKGGVNSFIGVGGAAGKSIITSAGGTAAWSSAIKTMTTANLKLRIASYNDKFFITNGTDAPFATDLSTVTDILLTAPDVSSATAIHNSGGELTPNAKYYYVLAYITDSGEISPPSAWMTHHYAATSNNTTSSGYQSITLASLPVSGDSRVVGRLLYRTQADGLTPFLLTRLDNVSTVYTDQAADTLLDLSQTVRYAQTITLCKHLATHKERLFMANLTLNDSAPKMIRNGYVSNGTVFAATANNTGELPAGTWKYRVCFIDTLGNVSGYLECSITLNGTTETGISLANIPQPIGEGIEVRIYRSKKDVYANNTDFFFRGSNWGETHTDILADTGLGTGTLPAATASTTGYTGGVIFSEIGKPSEVPAENFLLVYPDDNDSIMGLMDDGEGLLVFKQNSICRILTLGEPLNWQIHKIVSQIGCDETLSIQKIGERVYFLNNKQLYRYPDSVDRPVNSDLKTTLAGMTTLHDSAYSNFYQWYILIATCSSVRYILVYNEKLNTWYKFSSGGLAWECVIEKTYGSNRGKLIFGDSTLNTLWKYDESVSLDNATEINTWLRFKTLVSSEPNALYRLRKLWANYKKKDGQTVNHTFQNPEGSSVEALTGVTTDIATGRFSKTNIFVNGDRVMLGDIVTTTGINTSTVYYVVSASSNSFALSLTQGGAAVELLTGDGSCTVYPMITTADTTNATTQADYKLFKKITDAMTPTKGVTFINKLIYQIDGTGLTEFNGAKIGYREVNRGSRV